VQQGREFHKMAFIATLVFKKKAEQAPDQKE
jgi:hypothetical protein